MQKDAAFYSEGSRQATLYYPDDMAEGGQHPALVIRVLHGESKLADTFVHYPLDPATGDYVQKELSQVYGFAHPAPDRAAGRARRRGT